MYERKWDDLYYRIDANLIDVNLIDLHAGWTGRKAVRVLDGLVYLAHNGGPVTDWKFPGRGMPKFENPSERGDLYVGIKATKD